MQTSTHTHTLGWASDGLYTPSKNIIATMKRFDKTILTILCCFKTVNFDTIEAVVLIQ